MARHRPDGAAARPPGGVDRVRREVTRRAETARGATFDGFDALRRWMRETKGHKVYAATVSRPRGEVAGAEAEPLRRLRDLTEVELRDAPGGRGTEIVARRRTAGRPAGAEIRRLLRHTKQIIETGHIVRLSPQPSARGPVAKRTTAALDQVLSGGGQR